MIPHYCYFKLDCEANRRIRKVDGKKKYRIAKLESDWSLLIPLKWRPRVDQVEAGFLKDILYSKLNVVSLLKWHKPLINYNARKVSEKLKDIIYWALSNHVF